MSDEPEFDRRMLEVLVCPVTRAQLTYDKERQELVSRSARLAFPIRNSWADGQSHAGMPLIGPGIRPASPAASRSSACFIQADCFSADIPAKRPSRNRPASAENRKLKASVAAAIEAMSKCLWRW